MQQKVAFIGLATYRDFYAPTVASLFKAMTSVPEYMWALGISDTVNVASSRNILVEQFLDTPAEYLVFIDQDMVFEPDDLRELMRAIEDNPEAGAVSGFYIKRDGSLSPLCVWVEDDNPRQVIDTVENLRLLVENRGKLVEADLIPTGFMVIRREAIEALDDPWFSINFVGKNMWSSDSEFCHKIRESGWKTYCHLGLEIGHLGMFEWKPKHFYEQAPHMISFGERDKIKEQAAERFGVNSEQYWDAVWYAERELGITRQYQELHQFITQFVPEGSRVLDIGCGPGQLLRHLSKTSKIKQTSYGVDISQNALTNVRALEFKAHKADLSKEPLPPTFNKFDVVISTEVVEHLEDESYLIGSMKHACKPGGVVILSCPANCMGPRDEPEHVRTISASEITGWFEDFEDVDLYQLKHYWVLVARKAKVNG